MHEMSVALAVVDQVVEAAGRAGDVTAVRSVRLQVGELAGVVPDALAFGFELACAGTLLEGAELVTEEVPGRARCTSCAHAWDVGMPPRLTCPACGGTRTDLLAGRELQIVDVRWENGRPAHPSTREPISEER
ncbi:MULTISPECIES: hydrogenase maturation nickel metallochaperone HypA [Streptomyces]|uniref:Hydrogenase maturation factor HypA n=1 Tax=Streptomyces stelliscabiei TaxID=146820 RepID=A0A8I0TMJ0_9ACTN|nr:MULTISPECIES: hydrogenase maturation nickel metallochaperone HypA [Streptomyces]KND40488.1 hydrogenase nickel incorporation protein HypA [Streptomyces stelliscabiei]MBE1594665.1 hydrogenase nickel incorporation protein HypA/HybF [Streptomyces stelliscabiei]MDX2521141.1 hydrogenase maturation nickel metallochaperone HypA [Streptomyces stelliscabiei]MDX2550808.1 hydrogenase maturation nickel metallochaperone HypA [Streptomyces stelliscabiei]MDX2616809.1 hydrogenase maturation nickel metalloch